MLETFKVLDETTARGGLTARVAGTRISFAGRVRAG